MAELAYRRVGDYYIPNLVLDPEPEPEKFYGKYGDLRREYIQKHRPVFRPVLLTPLVSSGRPDDHLTTIERLAEIRIDKMLPQIMKDAGVNEELKARNQMAQIGLVNSYKATAEEIIYSELIYIQLNRCKKGRITALFFALEPNNICLYGN